MTSDRLYTAAWGSNNCGNYKQRERSVGRRLNILIVMADQMNPAMLPFHGQAVTQAPAMAALAERGVVFDAAYSNSPLCSPARAVLMSGRLPSATGVYDNAAEFRSDIPTFAHYLRQAGYRTILSGKMHFCGADQLHGFEQRLTTDIYPADFGWTPDWDRPHERPSWYHNMSSVTDAGHCVRTNQVDFDDEVAFAAERAIYDHVRSSDDRPFCLVASFTHPHDPFAIPDPWWSLHADADIPAPRFGFDPGLATAQELRLRHVCAMDGAEVSEADVIRARRAYLGAISYVDDKLGRLMAALRATGLADDTVVVLTSDHGEMLGERGAWYKMSFLEGSARIPLVISAPGRFAGRRVGAAVSLVDLLPTLVEIAGDGAPGRYVTPIDGRSLLPHLQGADGHDEVIGEYLAEGAVAPVVMIRRGTAKFIHSPADPDQLYDLAVDPDERRNLGATAKADAFRREATARWDLARIDAAVRDSQRRRHMVVGALGLGASAPWDYTPPRDAARDYIRNHMDLDDLEARARYPRVRQS
ncbi:MAG: choline-sulfatase [Alphaproteobacteria bacterium]|jgi:choline-sulfatase|nr:choline-sulfatase [Alphaproteobacteria bacterium]